MIEDDSNISGAITISDTRANIKISNNSLNNSILNISGL